MALFVVLLLWMILTALVGVIVESILGRRHKLADRAPSDPRCGQCGYIVTGLPSHVCPECGSDLRVVGIKQAPVRTPIPDGVL